MPFAIPTAIPQSHHPIVVAQPATGRLTISPNRKVQLFGWMLCCFGLLLAVLGALSLPVHVAALLPLVAGLILLVAGKCLLGPRLEFDQTRGTFDILHLWRRRSDALEKIIAVEIANAGVFESGNDDAEAFVSHALKLIVSNQPPVLVAYQHDVHDLRKKAAMLAAFLGVPLR